MQLAAAFVLLEAPCASWLPPPADTAPQQYTLSFEKLQYEDTPLPQMPPDKASQYCLYYHQQLPPAAASQIASTRPYHHPKTGSPERMLCECCAACHSTQCAKLSLGYWPCSAVGFLYDRTICQLASAAIASCVEPLASKVRCHPCYC